MSSPFESVKVDLPLPVSVNGKTAIQIWSAQSPVIKQCSLYATTAPVQAAVTDADAAVAALQGTETEIDQTRAKLAGLEKTRGTQLGVVHLKHDGVVAALNAASNNDPDVAKAWVGKTVARAKPPQVPAGTGAPVDPKFGIIKQHPGSTRASCTKEAGAVACLFQYGTDPNHPESWPAPIVVRGNTHTLRNQPIGQVLCARIAVVRHGSVQGAWSIVLQLTVR